MPRKPCDSHQELRLTLGDFERKQIKEAIETAKRDSIIKNTPQIMLGTAAIGLVGVIGYGAYLLYKGLNLWPELSPGQQSALARTRGFFSGEAYNPRHPEWAIFGVPDSIDQLILLHEQNRQHIEDKAMKLQATVDATNALSGVVGAVATAAVSNAADWLEVGYPRAIESLELWRVHWEAILQ